MKLSKEVEMILAQELSQDKNIVSLDSLKESNEYYVELDLDAIAS